MTVVKHPFEGKDFVLWLPRVDGLPKLVARRPADGHWAYSNTLDSDDNGTANGFMLLRARSLADFRATWHAATHRPAPEWFIGRRILQVTLDIYRPLIRFDRKRRVLFALSAAAEILQALVTTENAVKTLSLAQINRCHTHPAFLSTAGAPAPRQCKQISLAAHRLPNFKTVILM